jgi:glycosyl hydrolase family 123
MLKTVAAGASALGSSLALPAFATALSTAVKRPGEAIEHAGVKFWLESSLTRIYPNSPPGSAAPLSLVSARNARVSFQACFRNLQDCSVRVRATLEGKNLYSGRIRRVGYVPQQQLNTDVPLDELDGIGHVPGFVPDPLFPEQTAHVGPQANGAFWITLFVPADAEVGDSELTVVLTIEDRFQYTDWIGGDPSPVRLPVKIDVRQLVIKKRKDFPATNWISADSIWEYYKIKPFSERFWELADAFIKNLTEHNFNTIYSPIFNARHEILKRPAQLLRVRRVADDKYEFDFSDVRRWINLARKNQAEYFEWTHFFTPAPTSGRFPQRIFERWDSIGELLWPPEISATSSTYRKFLEQFLPQFKQVLEDEKILDHSFFHCADEPDGDVQMADYRKARGMLRELAPWIKVIDAMSDPRFANEGLTEIPVPSIATAHLFSEANCPAWVYFCCGPRGKFLQRLHDTPLPKLRMAGWLFYKLNAKGFLHWGHNYWFKFCTSDIDDPFQHPDVGAWPGLPYGDPFVVYPGPDGPIDSIRWEVLAESLQDFALLQSAELPRDAPLLSELKSYQSFPKQAEWIDSAVDIILG